MIHIKDRVSGLTHLFGAVMSLFALLILVSKVVATYNLTYIIAFIIFGMSLILLYSASAIYHLIDVGNKPGLILRKIDHMMIYVLIAGTYTPICLIVLKGPWGYSLLVAIWSLAIIGILLKVFWFNAPRWLSTAFYIAMGWLVVIAFFPLVKVMSPQGVVWLILGGVLYSVGGVIYATKWCPVTFKEFGFHELFHIFVLAGSFCHFLVMYIYVL